MIKIGLFSQLAQVSIRTLRHYADLGLLKPEFIDPKTNYRYYTLEQLPRLTRILAFKDMGLSLEQISVWINRDLSIDQLRKMLYSKQEELSEQIEQSTQQLRNIEARLLQIEQEGKPSPYEVILKNVAPYSIVSIREIIPTIHDMVAYRCRMFNDLYLWLTKNQIHVNQELVLYHAREFVDHNFDIETAVIIDHDCYSDGIPAVSENISINNLPSEAVVASLIHSGSFMQVGYALSELFKWITLHGFSPIGPTRELHLFGRENNHDDYNSIVVELQIPVLKNK